MQAWEEFLCLQEGELGKEVVKKWLRPLKIVQFDACNLYLEAANSFQLHWFEEHIRDRARQLLRNNNHKLIKVHLAIKQEESQQKSKKFAKKNKEKNTAVQPQSSFSIAFDELDPHCTFDNFFVTASSALPYKLLCQTTGYDPELKRIIPKKMELGNYNPIYLCGPSGVGKTHLLMAVAHVLRKQGKAVTYVRAESFTEHVVTAIRAGEMNLFRQSYRNTDVLIIDDIHVLARKSATQEEVFHTFNTLHVNGRQIILSANCLPGELQYIEPRLVSRFEWGIVTPLQLFSKEEMRHVLQTKAAAIRCSLPLKIQEFLLDTFASSCKAVTRALEALILRSHLEESNGSAVTLTLPVARKFLNDLIEEELKSALNSEKVIQHVTDHFGIHADDILRKAQSRDCVLPRQMAMYFCRTQLQMPFMRIGEIFSKDHSTVMSSVKLIQKALDGNDENILSAYSSILKKIRT